VDVATATEDEHQIILVVSVDDADGGADDDGRDDPAGHRSC
jgi:hypothetical protein